MRVSKIYLLIDMWHCFITVVINNFICDWNICDYVSADIKVDKVNIKTSLQVLSLIFIGAAREVSINILIPWINKKPANGGLEPW